MFGARPELTVILVVSEARNSARPHHRQLGIGPPLVNCVARVLERCTT